MSYEYNGHLLENERINLVANEIVNKYPQISFDKAKEAAMLEGKISTEPTLEIKFNRLYNIMLVMDSDKSIVKTVYIDLVNLLDNNSNDEKIDFYNNISLKIVRFLLDEIDFPYLV